MALKHTILAFLSRQPLSGYEVAKEFAEGFGGCFWKASQQQVYAELSKLEKQDRVIYEAIPQPGRLDKKIYSITAKGQEELIDWLTQPTEPTAIREDLGVIGLAGHLVPSQMVVREIERRQKLHREMAQHLKKMDEHFAKNLDLLELKDLYMHLVIRRAIRYQEDWVAWCDESLKAINRVVDNLED
ncbi:MULTISPECIES: PadR family transcriptional regulator [Synechocystis]|uniref:PadR family transcriptional regulator n=1 Tax=Synechocystis salina LEGE 00031 TaxID=1828736 RepID=A0ABR9VRA4_9SYNC|nr:MULTISPECIES: PadR family transcriptional regulator [Synechocystis]MBD2655455.1 PadR family transcriptional regulator [Synechocystis sp. FACHB-383]MBE9195642.1 PadR family transcriptional regulator [Synechocystis sp. LEGE 06083]MBE9242881.1 PadR family transcriptional regulator [Synechocystis salina LEGE 00041]MBE9253443.1 PadR family transcriptional regulator [Synechocystis salina LEGE 00031]